MFWKIILVIVFLNEAIAMKCIDENNNEVDWYVTYKLPRLKTETNQLVKAGEAYMFITSEDSAWKLSNVSISDTENSFFVKTLGDLYKKQSDKFHLFYNDEPPEGPKKSLGHTKGVISGDETGGFWIVHSVPLFPPSITENYSYPKSGTIFGQSILCLSLNSTALNEIGLQLIYNQVEIYSSFLPEKLADSFPNIKNVIKGHNKLVAPWFHVQKSATLNKQMFISFAKSKLFDKELYEDLVAPYLNANLLVETWLNGPGKLPSNCSRKFKVNNIKEISIDIDGTKINFPSTQDHSKWAVNHLTNTLCIGDINREDPQRKRGGGTVCLASETLATAYRNIIGSIEDCSM